MDFFNDFLFPSIVVVGICYAIYRIWARFDAERERQRTITRPRTVARISAGNLREAPDDKQGGYLPELDIPYVYYQQGEKRRGRLIAPGSTRLRSTHAWVLAD